MLEKQIERRLVEGVKKRGGLCYKFVSPGHPGVPDRIVIKPDGKVIFVELKTDTGRLSKLQNYTIRELREHGADVRVIWGLDGVSKLLEEVGE
ncbi:MAG: VRR-NUC domain-containing protein [Schwartzia sp.]|nr:VRR-NUC domain-containing protein [Schwartzia sp. (in: firmicutes)]